MNTQQAFAIVNECVAFRQRWGYWPLHTADIIEAFEIIQVRNRPLLARM